MNVPAASVFASCMNQGSICLKLKINQHPATPESRFGRSPIKVGSSSNAGYGIHKALGVYPVFFLSKVKGGIPMTKEEAIDFVKEEAENYGVPFDVAMAIWDVLGESEMFDGFPTSLEDAAADYM